MKARTMWTTGLCLTLAVANAAWGHDKSGHQGKATHGRVEAVAGDRVTLRTEAGTVVVTLDESTKIARDEKTVGRDTLRPGVDVAVIGTKLPGGDVVAKEILIGGHEEPATGHEGHSSEE